MPPQTPRSTAKSGYSLTPSFAFNLGLLPSFRFPSPQNLSLFTSLSPHRILNRFSRSKEPAASAALESHAPGLPAPVKEFSFDLPKQKLMDSFAHTPALAPSALNSISLDPSALNHSEFGHGVLNAAALDLNVSDLACTSESVDLWSLNESHHNATNVTAIHEDTPPGEFYYSPEEFLSQEAKAILQSSPALDQLAQQKTPSRKRKLSLAQCSPSEVIAGHINKQAKTFGNWEKLAGLKTWTPALDSALIQCQANYNNYQRKHSADGFAHKHALQNKVLSRLLHKTTGVSRTAKQISLRLLRLSKARDTKENVSAAESVHSAPDFDVISALLSSPVSAAAAHSPAQLSPSLRMEELTIAFNYRQQIQGTHYFTRLLRYSNSDFSSTTDREYKPTGDENTLLGAAFQQMRPKLIAQSVPVLDVHATMDFRPNEGMTSTPTSPLSNPHLFTLDNGSFLAYVNLHVDGDGCREPFLSWKSTITVYKGKNTKLLESTEPINGYRNEKGDFSLEVPFLTNFWSGYLTFLANGTNRFEELQSLYVMQVIHEGGKGLEMTNIHGLFTYKFDLAADGPGDVAIKSTILKAADDVDMDDNATVLMTSSPTRSSPGRPNFSIDTALANRVTSPGPMSVPTYDANLLYKLNPNYNQTPGRPALSRFSSVPHASFPKAPAAPHGNMVHSYSSTDLLTPLSAGQNDMASAHPSQYNLKLQGVSCLPPGQAHHPENAPLYMGGPSSTSVACNDPRMGNHLGTQAPRPGVPIVTITSAPASQMHFFPEDAPPKEAAKQTITFGPILEYDPSKSRRGQPKRSKGNPSIHKFQLTRQIMYKPKKET